MTGEQNNRRFLHTQGEHLKQKNWLSKSFFLSRDATVPQPGIRVGFIPGGSTDSVSVMVTLTMVILMLVTLMVLTLLVVILLVVFDVLEHLGINIDIQIIRETIWLCNELIL